MADQVASWDGDQALEIKNIYENIQDASDTNKGIVTADDIGIDVTNADLSLKVPVDNKGTATTDNPNQLIQRGWGFSTGTGVNVALTTVTFPVAFDDAEIDITIAYLGSMSGSDPTTRASATTMHGAGDYVIKEGTLSATGFTATFLLSTGTVASNWRMLFSWIAIGTKT